MSAVRFGWFGAEVTVRSALPALASALRELWAALPPPAGGAGESLEFAVERVSAGGFVLHEPRGRVLLDGRRPVLHAYNRIVEALLGRLDHVFALHATTVTRGDRGLILAGPAGSGKSTLGWALVQAGAALLADDVTVLERQSGLLLPFPRMLRPRPAPATGAASRAFPLAFDDGPRLRPADVPVRRDPVRPGCVILLHAEGDEPASRFPLYEIAAVDREARVLEGLAALPGVERYERLDTHGPACRLHVTDSQPLQAWLAAHRASLVYALKLPARRPSFAGAPRVEALGRFRTALELCQEMLNRHPGSAVAREFAGREPQLVGEVASLLRGSRCLSLVPGRLPETAAVLEGLLKELA